MRVLITGGAGYIGTSLCEELLRNNAVTDVVIYDNLSRHNYNLFIGKTKLDERVKFIDGDILDSRKLRKAVKNADVVYHLAAKVTTPFADQDAHLFEQVNHWGTAEVTYAVEESSVKKLIYLSSVSVYGSGDDQKNLDSQPNPRTFYGISKMRGEDHVKRLQSKCETHIIRCGNVYGYNRSMRFDAVINKFLFEANFHGKINIHGSGEQQRPFVHVETVAAHLSGLLRQNSDSTIENLVEHNFQVNQIVEVLRELYPDLEIIFINNNLKLRELKVETTMMGANDQAVGLLRERLKQFQQEFTF
ncbi:MAG: NAD-dependent epimerase/dehydratase family protein [Flavobacteriales bacterium]